MNAIGYLRCSTSEQVDSGLGLGAQRSAIESAAGRLGLTVKGWCADEGISGGASLDKRIGLLEAIEVVRKGDVLLVAKRDRLARDVLLSAWVEKEVTKRGGRIVSAAGEGTDSDDPTAMLMRRIIDAFAEYERLVIRARTKAALRVKARRGERVSGRIPLGFRLASDGTTLIRDEAEQAVINDILAKRRQGWKLQRIAADLNARAVPTKCGNGGWRHQTISQLIRRRGNSGGTEQ